MARMIAVAALSFLVAPSSVAAEQNSASIGISATVPVICRIEASSINVPANSRETFVGTFVEMCNTDASYGVMLHHRQLTSGENGKVSYRGKTVELSPDGHTMLEQSSGPVRRQRTIEIRDAQLNSPLGITVVMIQH